MILEYLKQQFVDVVGRYSFLTAADIERVTRRAAGTVLNDYRKGLIRSLSSDAKFPKFDIGEVHAYLIRIKWLTF